MSAAPELWAVVPFPNTYARDIRQTRATWGKLVETFTTFKVRESKAKLPAWSPAIYKEGATRGSAGVVALSCLVLDYDNGKATIEDARAAWGAWPAILHTSWSHTAEHHKFRVILPLWAPVPAEDWPGVFRWAESWTRTTDTPGHEMSPEEYSRAAWIHTIDPACKDPGRIFYGPAVRAEDWPRHAESWVPADRPGVYLGRYVPWDRHLKEYREQRARIDARKAAPPPTRRRKASVQLRQDRDSLKTCPHTREALGVALGGQVRGEQVRKVPCPRCGRAAVWYVINPLSRVSASCDHRNSCGWYGQLEQLKQGGDQNGSSSGSGVEAKGIDTGGSGAGGMG